MKMQKISLLLLSAALVTVSCEKKYKRPDVYATDLFADRYDTLSKKIPHTEARQRSAALIVSTNVKLLEKSADSISTPVFMYLLEDGTVRENKDTVITLPLMFLSAREIPKKPDSVYLYLEKVRANKILATQNGIRYQLIPGAPLSAKE